MELELGDLHSPTSGRHRHPGWIDPRAVAVDEMGKQQIPLRAGIPRRGHDKLVLELTRLLRHRHARRQPADDALAFRVELNDLDREDVADLCVRRAVEEEIELDVSVLLTF